MPTMAKHAEGMPAWADLFAWDLEKAQDFYGALFGWTFETGTKETNYYTMARYQGHDVAALMPHEKDAKFPPCWNLYFATENVDRALARVQELGGKVAMGPMDVMDAGRMAFAMDSTGAAFGLWQKNQFSGASLMDEPGSLVWYEVMTGEGEKAVSFYKGLFNHGADKLPMEGMQYWLLKKDGKEVGGVMQSGDAPPHWLVTFAVKDTDATADIVTQKGGKVIAPPNDSPYGRYAIFLDPGGASFGVITLAGEPPKA
ncbi:VOC family protein [Stigmatella sp. ncwal1]|uniref:VOC family protein n=1 Tax=Stigmatella ashevillensis TaxID=2995309 RepID=A0ABT5DJD6_9BACT|nr:VOC family protein [Stigmatella ashevillena]MDC0713770.1 VOC family protein [Stigmatella ashevillena]